METAVNHHGLNRPPENRYRGCFVSGRVCGVSIFAGLAFAVLWVIVAVPGVLVPDTLLCVVRIPGGGGSFGGAPMPPLEQLDGPYAVAEYEHGWPWPYLRRARGYVGRTWPPAPKPIPYGAPGWLFDRNAWPVDSDKSLWNTRALVGDLAVAVLGLIGVVTLCECWLRVRGGGWRPRLIDLLAGTAVLSALLGYYVWHAAEQRTCLRFADRMKRASGEGCWVGGSDWLYPVLPVRLFGRYVPRVLLHPTSLRLFPSVMSEEDWETVASQPFVNRLYLFGKRDLRLRSDGVPSESLPNPRSLRNVRYLHMNAEGKQLSAIAAWAAKLPRLEWLVVESDNGLVEDLMPLLKAPRLRLLEAFVLETDADRDWLLDHKEGRFEVRYSRFARAKPEDVAYERLQRRGVNIDDIEWGSRRIDHVDASNVEGCEAFWRELIVYTEEWPLSLEVAATHEHQALVQFVATCTVLERLTLHQRDLPASELQQLLAAIREVSPYVDLLIVDAKLTRIEVQAMLDDHEQHCESCDWDCGGIAAYREIDPGSDALELPGDPPLPADLDRVQVVNDPNDPFADF